MTLAQLPTPLQHMPRLSQDLGCELWMKRDDLTGFGLSGNKIRKLDALLADAQPGDVVLTTGGLQSNHCRATALACRRLGLHPVLLLRTHDGLAPVGAPDSNLLLDELLGAELHFCTPEVYRDARNAVLQRLAQQHRAQGRRALVVPEGGSNATGSRAFVAASHEAQAQAAHAGVAFDAVVVAVGSGGTLAGLAMGGWSCPVWGVAVCDDRPTFRGIVQRIAAEAGADLPAPDAAHTWDVIEGHQGAGYGLAGPEVWDTLRWAARTEGVLLDPVYTGKAMLGLRRAVAEGGLSGRVLFWHTGGAFGLFGRGAELRA